MAHEVMLTVERDRCRSCSRYSRYAFVLAFDDTGRVDTERFRKQQWALAESALDPALALPGDDESVLDAASRFVAQGGRWRPPEALAQLIDDAALGNVA